MYFAFVSDSPHKQTSQNVVPLTDKCPAKRQNLAYRNSVETLVEIYLHGDVGKTISTVTERYYNHPSLTRKNNLTN